MTENKNQRRFLIGSRTHVSSPILVFTHLAAERQVTPSAPALAISGRNKTEFKKLAIA
jgi:hypothetical protein